MTTRSWVLLALGAVVLVAVGAAVGRGTPSPAAVPPVPSVEPSASIEEPVVPEVAPPVATSVPLPVRRPPGAVAELGVLTDRTEAQLAPVLDRAALASKLGPDLCGDTAACDAVRAVLRDEMRTVLTVVEASVWSPAKADLDAGLTTLSAADRAQLGKLTRVVVVHVSGPPDPQALALRTALAVTALVARDVGGVVRDPLLARVEGAGAFAKHAVTAPLAASAFRRDRVEVLYEPRGEGMVRVVTAGMARLGQPDVEAVKVPVAVSARMADIVLGVAEALAGGASTQPVVLSLTDLARARGEAYPLDAGLPAPAPVEVDVVGEGADNGDASVFLARVVPAGGEGAIGSMDLAGRFFGPFLAASPAEGLLGARRAKAQEGLAAALARWDRDRKSGAKLLVLLPFAIPGGAGSESVWVEVTGYDARTVTGRVMDDPLGATDVKRGDEVKRPRAEIEDVDLRGSTP